MNSYRKELWFEVPTRRAFINITPQVEECLKDKVFIQIAYKKYFNYHEYAISSYSLPQLSSEKIVHPFVNKICLAQLFIYSLLTFRFLSYNLLLL